MGGLAARQARLNKVLDKAQIGSRRYRDIAKELGRVNNKLAQARTGARGFGQSVKKESAIGKVALSGMALGGWGAVIDQGLRAIQVVVNFGQRMIDASNQAQNATLALATVIKTKIGSEAIPQAEKEVKRLEKALKGAMDPASIRKAMKNLIAANFTIDQSSKLIEANAKIASTSRQSHLGLAESVVVYSEGIKNQNSILTDATGISENLSTTLKRQGYSMEDLTDSVKGAEARQALFNRHLEEAIPFSEAFNAQMESYQGHTARADAATNNLSVTIGDFLKKRLEPAQKAWADFLETLSQNITVESLDEVFDSLELVTEPLSEIFSSTWEIWELVGDIAKEIMGAKDGSELFKEAMKLLSRAINIVLTKMRLIHAVIKLILRLVRAVVKLFRGDFSGALEIAKSAFRRFADSIMQIIDKLRRAFLGIFEDTQEKIKTGTGEANERREKQRKQTGGGGGKSTGDKIKPTFFLDEGLAELEAAINLMEQGHTVTVDLQTINGGDLFDELEKAGLSQKSSKILRKQVKLDVEVLNEGEVQQLSNTSNVRGSTARNLERARSGEGPAAGTMRGTQATITGDDAETAEALKELQTVIKKSQEAKDIVVQLSAKTGEATEKSGKLAQQIAKVLNFIGDLAGRVSEIIQNSLQLQLQAMNNAMEKLNFFAEFYLASMNRQKETEIENFKNAEDEKIRILREAMNERISIIDEEMAAIQERLEQELALKIQQLEAEHLAQIDYIEANSADHEQELILKELQEQEFRERKEQLENEHEERLSEELQNANSRREGEKEKTDKEIQKLEEEKNKGLAKLEEERAAQERKVKKTLAVLQFQHDLAAFNVEKQIARTQVQMSTAQAVINAVSSSLAMPFPFNLVVMGITTGLALAAGAQQMALIEGQMPPMPPVALFFREGGLVPGPALPEDSVNARLTGGEFVVNRGATQRHLSLLEAINDDVGGRALPSLNPVGGGQRVVEDGRVNVILEDGSIRAVLEMNNENVELLARGISEKQGRIIHSAAF